MNNYKENIENFKYNHSHDEYMKEEYLNVEQDKKL